MHLFLLSKIQIIQISQINLQKPKIKNSMFIKSLKITRKHKNHQPTLQKQKTILSNISFRRQLSFNPQKNSQIQKKSKIKLILQNSCFTSPKNNKNRNKKLVCFENQYIKSLGRQEIFGKQEKNLDQRRKYIKEKIKGKVKEQLADLLKRSQFNHQSLGQMKIKDQILINSRVDVSVTGSSMKRSLKMSFSQRPELAKLQHLRRFTHKKISLRQSNQIHKPFTADQFLARQRQREINKKQRRSLSNVIRVHISQKKVPRNIHSALGDIKAHKKESAQIEPWQYTDEF